MARRGRGRKRDRQDQPKRVVICSYVPLLAGEPGRVLSVQDPEFQRLMREVERCPSGLADACLWIADNGGVFPVFVLPQAHAIAEHLVAWAEHRPGEWFSLCFAERRSRYVATLFPNIVRSVERFEAAHLVSLGDVSNAEQYELIFRPVALVSPSRHTFGQVRGMIGNRSLVGFLETADFDPARPLPLYLERIKRVGPFSTCWGCRPFGFDINQVVDRLVGSSAECENN